MRHAPILGLSTPSKPEGEGEVFIWGSSWVCRADLMAEGSSTVDEPSTHRKRKRTGNPDAFNLALQSAEEIPPLRVETRYKYICLVDFVGGTKSRAEDAMEVDEDGLMKEAEEDEMKEMMVVVERPVTDLLADGPGAFNRKKFGT
ncbi:hypothetical protein DACRYDRAFT_110488 [Dacryopinax primogenitus]|uniref:Uncharacterized protein n=1 Tax=Dacryopinax primogenitus (strain DJM 731) TaxID=1858805 RepID=M5G4A2_DACPD|nr:uncharacterized protein DACRYDRAFT_110488 [Dacryopinax primogenitus]EJT98577.1 hypothetical protein DACRYDRAFT_110488 [Dacryopinax primogenitus]